MLKKKFKKHRKAANSWKVADEIPKAIAMKFFLEQMLGRSLLAPNLVSVGPGVFSRLTPEKMACTVGILGYIVHTTM
jgi:hypothetical protein